MNADLYKRETGFRISMSMAKSMLNSGIISESDYHKIDRILAEKYNLTVSRNTLINRGFRGNMSPTEEGGESVGKDD